MPLLGFLLQGGRRLRLSWDVGAQACQDLNIAKDSLQHRRLDAAGV